MLPLEEVRWDCTHGTKEDTEEQTLENDHQGNAALPQGLGYGQAQVL